MSVGRGQADTFQYCRFVGAKRNPTFETDCMGGWVTGIDNIDHDRLTVVGQQTPVTNPLHATKTPHLRHILHLTVCEIVVNVFLISSGFVAGVFLHIGAFVVGGFCRTEAFLVRGFVIEGLVVREFCCRGFVIK